GTNVLTGLTGDSLKTVTVTGAGNFRVNNDLASTVTTFDGSSSTGNIRVGFVAGADVSVKTGSGNDRVDMNGGLTSKDTIALGEGIDRLVIVGADIRSAASEQLKAINAATGVEELEFDGNG